MIFGVHQFGRMYKQVGTRPLPSPPLPSPPPASSPCRTRCRLQRRCLHPARRARLSHRLLLLPIFSDNGRGILPRKTFKLIYDFFFLFFSVLLLSCVALPRVFRTAACVLRWRATQSETVRLGLRLSTENNLGFRR